MWTRSTGLGLAAASGHESAPIRWAWVSGNPAGMSQRRSGGHWVSGDPAGIESAAGRWELSQRRPCRDPRERRAWGSGNPGTSQRAWESHRRRRISPAIGGHEGIVAIGLAAIPPNSHALLQWVMAGLRAATSLPRDRHTGTKTKTLEKKRKNKTGWRSAAYG